MIETALLQGSEMQVRLLNLGCITQSLRLAHWDDTRSAVLGYQNSADYQNNPHYLGAVVGRVANRIEGAGFTLNGTHHRLSANEDRNTLHGGADSISNRLWAIEKDGEQAVQFRITSQGGDQGFPATVDFTVTVSLQGRTLTYDLQAVVSAPTPINMTQHNYYNLAGAGTVDGHRLTLPFKQVLQTRADGIPTDRTKVANTPMDFQTEHMLDQQMHDTLDTAYCSPTGTNSLIRLTKDKTELCLSTTQDSVQVYSAGKLSQTSEPFGMQSHAPFCGLCLEPQGYPNAVNRTDFPTAIVTPDTPYRNILKLTLSET